MKKVCKRYAALLALLSLLVVPNLAFAVFSTTNATLQMTGGSLSISSDASMAFGGKTVSSSDQTSTSSTTITITDTRGSAVGWTVTATSQHLTGYTINNDTANGGTMTITRGDGHYDGSFGYTANDALCEYTLTIATGGAAATATYNLTINNEELAGCAVTEEATGIATSANEEVIGTRVVTVDLSGSANANDKWYIVVDAFLFISNTLTCAAPVATSGSTDGLTQGSCSSGAAFAGPGAISSPMTLLTAPYGNGLGVYTQAESFSYSIHKNALAVTYNGDIVFTVT